MGEFLDRLRGARIARNIKRRNHYAPFFQASLTLLRHYNVLYVENSKVACTKVKKCLLEIDNYPNKWDQLIEKQVHIHNKELTGLIGAADLSPDGLNRVLTDEKYFRFGFVRNPYDRLLSAYKDKILAPQKSPDKINYVGVACRIKAAVSGGDPRSINLEKTPVTWPEFVGYVAKQRPYDMDRHWFHQHLTMWHPYCDFDFIGKFETFSDDLRTVLTKIGAPQEMIDDVGERANASFKTSDKFYTPELAAIVYRKFRKDFEIYDYDQDSWSNY